MCSSLCITYNALTTTYIYCKSIFTQIYKLLQQQLTWFQGIFLQWHIDSVKSQSFFILINPIYNLPQGVDRGGISFFVIPEMYEIIVSNHIHCDDISSNFTTFLDASISHCCPAIWKTLENFPSNSKALSWSLHSWVAGDSLLLHSGNGRLTVIFNKIFHNFEK